MSKNLRISPDLSLPLDAVTQTIGILAKRRAGKSYLARRLAEQLHAAGAQTVIVDPKGDWWGIRSSADAKGPGLPFVIIGGERGDVKLEPGGGEVVAKLVVEEQVSALLDLSLLRKYEVATFMTGFLESLYRLKAHEKNRTPMMLLIDEADAVAPQKPQRGEERMLGAAEDIVRRGGQRGIGCTVVTQRSAVLNKNVLTQVQILVALRTIAPQDLDAMNAWIDVHGTAAQRKTLMESLPSLPVGDAWVWSPGWPTDEGIFRRIHTSSIETFDSGATPKQGERRVEPKTVAEVDLAALTRQMAATIERAKADDPKELKAKIRTLEGELRKASSAKPSNVAPFPAKPRDVFAVKHAQIKRVEAALSRLGESRTRFLDAQHKLALELAKHDERIAAEMRALIEALEKARREGEPIPSHRLERLTADDPLPAVRERPRRVTPERREGARPVVAEGLTPARQRILDALAWLMSVGIGEADKTQLAMLADQSPTSSSYANNLGGLRTAGLIIYVHGGQVGLTELGRSLANTANAPRSSEEIQDSILRKLSPAKGRILSVLIAAYPEHVARPELAEQSGQSATSSSFANNLGSLRSLGVIDYTGGGVIARPVLFLEGA